tara:strand:+ start:1449 stop:2588 length:1140 start_codon:yes stop_codon:yes gene_type:complete
MAHLLEEYAKNLGVKISKPVIKDHFFPLVGHQYITIATEDDKPAKHYKHYDVVLSLLKPVLETNEIKVVQIGGSEPIKNVDHFLNISFKQKCFILSNSLLHLGCDGVLSHTASFKKVPTVNLFGNTFPNTNQPLFSSKKVNVNLAPEWDNKPCFNVEDPKSEINKIKPEEVAGAILKLLKVGGSINFKTKHVGAVFGQAALEVIPTSFIPLNVPEGQTLFLRVDYGYDEASLLEYAKNYKVTIMTDALIQPHGLKDISGNISGMFIFVDPSWDDIPDNYFKILKNWNIPHSLLVRDEKDLGIIKNKYFDLQVRRYNPERPKIENLSPDAQFFSSKRLIEGGKEYLSYAHWKKGLDGNNKVLDTPEYWKELDHFYIYEQN